MEKDNIINYSLFALIIIAIIIVLYFKQQTANNLKKNGVKVTGIVYAFETEILHGGRDLHDAMQIPVIRFVTEEGTWITQKGDGLKFTTSPYKKGEEVQVYYNSKNPLDFTIEKMRS